MESLGYFSGIRNNFHVLLVYDNHTARVVGTHTGCRSTCLEGMREREELCFINFPFCCQCDCWNSRPEEESMCFVCTNAVCSFEWFQEGNVRSAAFFIQATKNEIWRIGIEKKDFLTMSVVIDTFEMCSISFNEQSEEYCFYWHSFIALFLWKYIQ